MNVLVIGDGLLDFTRFGTSTRRSPESSRCPVLDETRQEWTLGGAANVARWLAADPSLMVTLVAPHGRDEMSHRFRGLCGKAGVLLSSRLFNPSLSVTVKERFLVEDAEHGRIHHLLRVDRDVTGKVRETDLPPLRHEMEEPGRYDAIVAIDYGKLTFCGAPGQALMGSVGWAPCVRIVNSKHPSRWRDIASHLLVCNQQEMVDSFGMHDHVLVRKTIATRCFIVTRGAGGVTAVLIDSPINRLTLTTDVVDVCGAGDAFTAGLTQATLHHTIRGLERLQPTQLVDILDNAQKSAAWCVGQIGCGTPLVPGESS